MQKMAMAELIRGASQNWKTSGGSYLDLKLKQNIFVKLFEYYLLAHSTYNNLACYRQTLFARGKGIFDVEYWKIPEYSFYCKRLFLCSAVLSAVSHENLKSS